MQGTIMPIGVSVIISNFNGERYLPKLLESLSIQQGVRAEVIVVDRNSSDGSAEILRAHSEIKVIREPAESGLATGYEKGAGLASHDLLFFSNEDLWLDSNCLRVLSERIDPTGRIGASDPWQWTYDGSVWIHGGTRFCNGFPTFWSLYPFCKPVFTVKLDSGEYVPFACAGAMMIHRHMYEQVGKWDKDIFLDLEDVDLFLRGWRAGWKCVTVPDARVYHAVGASNTKMIDAGHARVIQRRYVSARASMIILPIKYYSKRWVIGLFAFWWLVTFWHLICLQPKQAWWDLLAFREILKRLPAAWSWRRKSFAMTRPMAGENFFREQAFQKI